MTNPSEHFFHQINYPLLREQKSTLLDVIDAQDEEEIVTRLEGLLSLLDAIQDHAVDTLGLPEASVFPRGEDD